jgi:hypothetical protein
LGEDCYDVILPEVRGEGVEGAPQIFETRLDRVGFPQLALHLREHRCSGPNDLVDHGLDLFHGQILPHYPARVVRPDFRQA